VNIHLIEKNGFQLKELVDETSQTVVWKALQNTLDRTVIIRILKEEAAAHAIEVEHFLNIARRFARIKSDSLAAVFDIVSHGDLHYVVMEHVDGPTLEDLVTKQGPLPVDQILRIAAALTASLDQMWSAARIVHRNLKSSTIRLDSRGVAKITDFSLAIVAGHGVDATAMDGGHIVGTPCFLSPEQAQGTHTLTTQSDMYALGAVLYHAATGHVPFEESDVLSILAAHVKRQVPPPHSLNASIPVNFSWFVHRLMMKNPNNRYPNWDEVSSDIRKLMAGGVPACVRPDESYLSTISANFTPAPSPHPEGGAQEALRIRLNRKKGKDAGIAAFQDRHLVKDHAKELRQDELIGSILYWGGLALWLVGLFWFRAVYQTDSNRRDLSLPINQISSAVSQLTDSFESLLPVPEELKTPEAAAPDTNAGALPAAPAEIASTTNGAVKAAAGEAAPVVASGIPPPLAAALAGAFAKSDLASARHLVQTDTSLYREKLELASLVEQMPDPDRLVTDYLSTQVGKPIIFEHNGKQRTVTPRSVANGVVHIEINGHGAEFSLDKLSADQKLSWTDKPKDAAQSASYCLLLMRSSRRSELQAYAAGCPLLAPVLDAAAALVPETPTPAVE